MEASGATDIEGAFRELVLDCRGTQPAGILGKTYADFLAKHLEEELLPEMIEEVTQTHVEQELREMEKARLEALSQKKQREEAEHRQIRQQEEARKFKEAAIIKQQQDEYARQEAKREASRQAQMEEFERTRPDRELADRRGEFVALYSAAAVARLCANSAISFTTDHIRNVDSFVSEYGSEYLKLDDAEIKVIENEVNNVVAANAHNATTHDCNYLSQYFGSLGAMSFRRN